MTSMVAYAKAVYTRYVTLMREAPEEGLGGRLLLAQIESELDEQQRLLMLVRAANIAGAATLLVGADPATARAQVRSGCCDFVVTTLDEALRVLKNEVRKRRQVAVFLLGSPAAVTKACLERGVQPELLASPQDTMEGRGARVVPDGCEWPAAQEMAWWTATRDAERIEALALACLGPPMRAARSRWLIRAPQYLDRELARVKTLPVTDKELACFSESVRSDLAAGLLTGEILIRTDDVGSGAHSE